MKKMLFLFLCSISQDFYSQSTKYTLDDFNKLSWIIGTWEAKLDTLTNTEIWRKENDSVLNGRNHYSNRDLSKDEICRFLFLNGEIFYESSFEANNEKRLYKLIKVEFDSWILLNIKLNPIQISYSKGLNNSMICGNIEYKNGRRRSRNFPTFYKIEH